MKKRPRTPRYWPRMKVRGAARKRKRTMYLFQRIAEIGQLSAADLNLFASRFAEMPIRVILGRDPGPLYGCDQMQVTAEDLDRLGESIMKGSHEGKN